MSDDVPDGVNRTDFKPGQQPGNYSYDPTGNLTSDRQEGILSIQWNVQGKVKSIRKTGNQSDLEFVYDASGNRLQKIEKTKTAAGVLKPASQWITTYYNRDAQGHVMGIYEYRDQRLFLKEQPIYGASRLGVLNRNQDLALADPFPNHRVLGNKLYELSNHLGNVQTTISDRKYPIAGAGPLIILQNDFSHHYSPMALLNGLCEEHVDVEGGRMNLHSVLQNQGATYNRSDRSESCLSGVLRFYQREFKECGGSGFGPRAGVCLFHQPHK